MEVVSEIFIVLAYIAAIGFFVFGIDDFLFDLQFVIHLLRSKDEPHIALAKLRSHPEKYIAIMVPAWQEGGVVNRMADYAVKILEYGHYDIFVGVYPNDPETIACVDAITRRCPRIHKVMCPNPGPTSKADCLNAIYHAICLHEIPEVREYQILALHDSEDVMHPLTLKVYNYFVPDDVEMGQIPVFPLELPALKYWVANTYMDDFSELHLKDMLARQEMGGVVPSAGVGTAFSRRAIDYLADHNNQDPFLVGNLTEDYFIGIQLKRAGFKAGFINYPIDRVVTRKSADARVASKRFVTEIVAVRENFPAKFWAAVRQRSRWILGISMQCWELAGWEGSMSVRYTLLRDRRAPLVHLINFIGYVVILSWAGHYLFWLSSLGTTDYWRPLFTPDSFLWGLILVDTAFLIYRLAIKSYYVSQVYGWKQGIFSIPRYPIGNFINFFATCRALWMYFQNRVFGKQLVWLKTTHVFPSAADLSEFAASIEDLLIQGGIVTQERLEQLVREGGGQSIPMHLLKMRLMEEEQFTSLWAGFSGVPEGTVVLEDFDLNGLEHFPERTSLELEVLPIRQKEDGHVEAAFLEPPSPEIRKRLENELGRPLTECLITPTNLRILRDFGYSTLAMPRYRPAFVDRCPHLDPEKSRQAREIQFRTGRRFSDVTIDLGIMSPQASREKWGEIFAAEPLSLADEQVDLEAFEALGPVFCYLHRMAPLAGGRLIFQDSFHPEVLQTVSDRLGSPPKLVADVAASTRRFLRNAFEQVKPEILLVEQLSVRGSLTAEQAAEIDNLRSVLNEPIFRLLEQFGGVDPEAIHQALVEIVRLPFANAAAGANPAGVMRPNFEETTGCQILEAVDGKVTFGLTRLLAPQDFSQICTRLNRCAVRFVLPHPSS